MKEKLNVLSLFDGMSCGQLALQRAGIEVENYFASEIDKHAIAITQKNFPNTKQVGDITKLTRYNFPDKIDLVIGGSPCQGFSMAGKQLNFDDPRSKLFFEYVRVLKDLRKVNPEIKFLLENVKMKKEYQDVISKTLGVEPIEINSNLVSAQNRRRLYWTNIENVSKPEDKGILLKHIIQEEVEDKYYITEKRLEQIANWKSYQNPLDRLFTGEDKVGCLLASDSNKEHAGSKFLKIDIKGNLKKFQDKASCFTAGANSGGNHSDMDLLVFNKVVQVNTSKESNNQQPYMQNRVYDTNYKAPALTQVCNRLNIIKENFDIRRLTPIECERLQTVPDNYTQGASDSQRYKMLGNGWTVDVIAHIFSHL